MKMLINLEALTVFLACFSTSYGLQASNIPSDTPLSSLIASAKAHLAEGFARDALLYFDAAISRDPTNYLTIFQRGATYLSLGRSSQALGDFDRVLQLKPDFESALLQRARLRAKSADWEGALNDLEKAGKRVSAEYEELQKARDAALQASDAENRGDWELCVNQANTAILKASTSLALRQTRAHCRFEKGEMEEGISDLAHVVQISPRLVEPHLQISSMLFYALGDRDRGISQIRKCLHSDPDSKPCNILYKRERKLIKILEKLRNAMDARKFNNAINLLVGAGAEKGLIDEIKDDFERAKEAGHIHSAASSNLYSSLVEQTCEAYREVREQHPCLMLAVTNQMSLIQANMLKRAAAYCLETSHLTPHSLAALLYNAQVALDEERFEDAVRTLNDAREHHPGSRDVQTLLQKAHVLLKRSKQKDYYKVLGVGRDADERTIKRAYRQLTKQHHPDKAISQGVTKEEAEKKMAAINEAYEVLSDPELRARYDNGDDPNDPESQRGNPFQGSPFGSGGGQQFFFQQGAPQFKFSGQGFNFPGGFPFR
ncbi:DnaJ and TPR domain protein [Aspergillus clavatus NRRL 1]|uniref:Tetratricopeptide repeat and J domain-containing co-chaperone DNJ1 n=1 Tax=Aspergillus clavatus (strain ATCC 1007 / CBS 513.65 / DSM 816 / NCTC 3887 / NRRL 1 / QM 1276 / 107) TaxID=344612 RepID=A1CJ15_ASPCL|nr:DnaJ and TPR domain protein [Aspergillus clavatus NRRL 1]EAW09139.1 DnaJ and TPR domain protein [Aspergillus clavatus NRRL 1]